MKLGKFRCVRMKFFKNTVTQNKRRGKGRYEENERANELSAGGVSRRENLGRS